MLRRWAPNALTLGNLLLGMSAVLLSAQGFGQWAAIVIMIGMGLDGLDGRIAHWLRVQSEYGKELDSLADIVTFGVAPAALMYMAELRHLGVIGVAVALLFPAAGALRLALFNVRKGSDRYFVGLPITAAGGMMAAFSLYHGWVSGFWMPGVTVLLSLLMVSRARYPNFKKLDWPCTAYVAIPLIAALLALVFVHQQEAIFQLIGAILLAYGLFGIWFESRVFWCRLRYGRTFREQDTRRDSVCGKQAPEWPVKGKRKGLHRKAHQK